MDGKDSFGREEMEVAVERLMAVYVEQVQRKESRRHLVGVHLGTRTSGSRGEEWMR